MLVAALFAVLLVIPAATAVTVPYDPFFASQATIADFGVATRPFGIAAGDFDEDGKLDVVTDASPRTDARRTPGMDVVARRVIPRGTPNITGYCRGIATRPKAAAPPTTQRRHLMGAAMEATGASESSFFVGL